MNSTKWHTQSVRQLATALHEKTLSPWALFDYFWQRASKAPQEIWTLLNHDAAAAQARASQLRWENDQRLGWLDGIPVAIKDAVDVQGQVTAAASATRKHCPAAQADAVVVARLRAQGMVLMGRTNMSEFAFSGLGINPHYGTPVLINAQGQICAPGGSSSGAAMALVHGAVPLALGTDTSGSARVPCSWNGLVGFRPSAGRYPMEGVYPLAPALDVCGPMAHTVDDVCWFDALMAGQSHPQVVTHEVRHPQLWVPKGLWLQDLDAEVAAAWHAGLEILESQGWQVVEQDQPAMQAAMDVQAREGMLVSAQAAQVHAGLLADPQALALLHHPVRERLQQAQQLPADAQARLLQARTALQAQWNKEVGQHTAVIIPTTAGLAPELAPLCVDSQAFAAANMRALRNTLPSSFLGAPSITLPLPAVLGQACGLQLSAAIGNDSMLLQWAKAVEKALAVAHTTSLQ